MRFVIDLLCVAALLCLFGLVSAGCLSGAQYNAGRELATASIAVTDPSSPGGAEVTPDERARLESLYENLKGAEGVDWSQLGAGVLASLATVIPALRFLPSRFFLGSEADPDVKRAAGLPVEA